MDQDILNKINNMEDEVLKKLWMEFFETLDEMELYLQEVKKQLEEND